MSVGLVKIVTCATLAHMTQLEKLRQEIATLQAEEARQRSLLHETSTLLEDKQFAVAGRNHPDHIRHYRKDERRDRADRKQRAREERRAAKA